MSSLIKIRKNKFIKQLGKNKEAVVSIFVFFIFLAASAVIIKNINPVKEDVPNYFELSENPYVEYEELLNRTDLKKIMDSRQFLEMRYDEDIIKKEDPLEKEDPFIERFSDEYNDEDDENGENGENENNEENEDANKKGDSEERDNEKGDNEN
ncbi:MAG: hypothetical protein U9N04_03600 [Patescibacteria group bacterium]|nr:hypothetical protein [Patescibacteria group bacterium]